jgi:hypothetical protein
VREPFLSIRKNGPHHGSATTLGVIVSMSFTSHKDIANMQCNVAYPILKTHLPIKLLIQDHSQLFYLVYHPQLSSKKSKIIKTPSISVICEDDHCCLIYIYRHALKSLRPSITIFHNTVSSDLNLNASTVKHLYARLNQPHVRR